MKNYLKYNSEKFTSCLNTFRETFSSPEIDNHQGSVILPLDFSLEMDGISGIIPHSAFEIPTNCLPTNYIVKTGEDKGKSKIAFILHTIDHNFNNNKWTTKITGQTLNIRFDELTEIQKEAIKRKKRPKITGNGKINNFSTVRGGTTKNIKGITYKNGQIPTNKLRPILNEDKWNNPSINKSDGGRVRLFEDASLSLDKLLAAAEHANIKLKINSAYRTLQDQERVFKQNCSRGKCSPPTARPGTSNHGFGLAVDFAIINGKKLSENNIEYKWLAQNASTFGFKRIASEAWHWEYQLT